MARGKSSNVSKVGGWALAPLWNRRERRLRMPWRLAILGVVWGGAQALLSWGIRGTAWPWLIWPGTLLITLGAMALVGAALDHRPLTSYGLVTDRAWCWDLLFGLALGAALMTLIYATQLAAGWIQIVDAWVAPDGAPFLSSFAEAALIFVCLGAYEEMLFRGYLLPNLSDSLPLRGRPRANQWLTLAVGGLLFGAAHMGNPSASLASTLGIALGGVVLGMAFVLTGRLGLPIGLHITWNLFQGNVFGFPVSGRAFGHATVLAMRQGGPALWTGGAFGPEAGLLGMLALLAGGVAIWLWARRTYGRVCDSALLTPRGE